MTAFKKFDTKSRAAQIAAQKKAAEDAQKAYDASLKEALKHAAPARVEFVENLYSYFEIEAGTTARIDRETGEPVRAKDGSIVMVKTDRNEHARIEKLGSSLADLFSALDDAQGKIADQERELEELARLLGVAKAQGFDIETIDEEASGDEANDASDSAGEGDEVRRW